jgi:hypothetical protein
MITLCVYTGAEAADYKDSVDVADLVQLSLEVLDTLKDVEFNVFLAKIQHIRTKAEARKAKDALKAAKLALNSKNLRVKTAQAEVKEAKAAPDQGKIDAAEKALNAAKGELAAAKMFVKWKEQQVDVADAAIENAKIMVAIKEAEREVAWATKLKEQKVPAAANYIIPELKKKVEKKQKELEAVITKEKKEMSEANKLKADYEKLFK